MVDAEKYGPWAVIAGGSEGVGSAFARKLAADGINIVLIARKPEPLRETAEQVKALGVEVRVLAQDLIAPDATSNIAAATDDLDVGLFIFNAGSNTYRSEFVEGDLDGFQRVIDLNITAPMHLSRHFGARLKKRGRGGLILVGSTAGYIGAQTISVYAATKAFQRILAEGMWFELRQHGVEVLELVLGATRTPAMERVGLRLDLPGLNVAEPEDVAQEGLDHIADGPVWIAGGNMDAVLARNGFPRDKAMEEVAEGLRKLLGG